MPTKGDFEELLALETEAAKENSDYIWEYWTLATDADGNEVIDAYGKVVRGFRITRKSTGATLFLPAAGYVEDTDIHNVGSYCPYWSSSLCTNNPCAATYMFFNNENVVYWSNRSRTEGLQVRPVCVE